MKSKEVTLAGLMILLCASLYLVPILNLTEIPPPLFLYCLFHPLLSRRMKNFFESSIYVIAAYSMGMQWIKFQGIFEYGLAQIDVNVFRNFELAFVLFFYWYRLMIYRVEILIFSSILQYIGFYKRVKSIK